MSSSPASHATFASDQRYREIPENIAIWLVAHLQHRQPLGRLAVHVRAAPQQRLRRVHVRSQARGDERGLPRAGLVVDAGVVVQQSPHRVRQPRPGRRHQRRDPAARLEVRLGKSGGR
eukprot:407110-Pyramimonas_sp.AAC.1